MEGAVFDQLISVIEKSPDISASVLSNKVIVIPVKVKVVLSVGAFKSLQKGRQSDDGTVSNKLKGAQRYFE